MSIVGQGAPVLKDRSLCMSSAREVVVLDALTCEVLQVGLIEDWPVAVPGQSELAVNLDGPAAWLLAREAAAVRGGAR